MPPRYLIWFRLAAPTVLAVPGAPLAFHVMAKPTGATCNLDCEYCFFLSKEMLYSGSRFRMAADLQETYLRQLLEAHALAPEVVVAWRGGGLPRPPHRSPGLRRAGPAGQGDLAAKQYGDRPGRL